MNNSLRFILPFVLIIFFLIGCGAEQEAQSNESDDRLSIYTTLYPLEFFAKEIGGSHVDVISILPAGADPHTFEPTSKTMVDIATADAFIYNGADLEAYAETIKSSLEDEPVLKIEASSGVALLDHIHDHTEEGQEHEEVGEAHDHTEETHEHEESEEDHQHTDDDSSSETDEHDGHDHGDLDPHLWLDPMRAVKLAENIKDTLVELKPEAKDEFEANFNELQVRLEELDQEFHNQLENQKRREILVTHAAYGYWESSYGIEQVAISGVSSTQEPSQKQLEKVINTVKEHDINYLLFEQNVEPKVASVIQNETNVEALHIHNLSVLTDEDIDNEEDYFTLMNKNLEVLVTALSE